MKKAESEGMSFYLLDVLYDQTLYSSLVLMKQN